MKKITVKSLVDLRKMLHKTISIYACMECLKEAQGDIEVAFYLAKFRYPNN